MTTNNDGNKNESRECEICGLDLAEHEVKFCPFCIARKEHQIVRDSRYDEYGWEVA